MLMNSLCAMPHTHRGRAIFKRIVSHSADLSLKRLLLLRTVVWIEGLERQFIVGLLIMHIFGTCKLINFFQSLKLTKWLDLFLAKIKKFEQELLSKMQKKFQGIGKN